LIALSSAQAVSHAGSKRASACAPKLQVAEQLCCCKNRKANNVVQRINWTMGFKLDEVHWGVGYHQHHERWRGAREKKVLEVLPGALTNYCEPSNKSCLGGSGKQPPPPLSFLYAAATT
jgi:hypothetical protein